MSGWCVVNNITGKPVTRVFDTEEKAEGLCAAFNTDVAGGVYSVRKV